MSEQKMCKKCGVRPAHSEVMPFCALCFNTLDLSDPVERNEYRYYGQKLEWEKYPHLWEEEKKRRAEYRKTHKEEIKLANRKYQQTHKEKFAAYQKKYKETHREQWNAYQREYKKRKAAENKALRERVAQLEAQLDKLNTAK